MGMNVVQLDTVTLTGTQTLTNKTIAAGSNTITGLTNANLSGTAAITNANLANSSVTINGTAVALGASGTITEDASTLTGTTLASGVTASSLTSFGTSPTLVTPIIGVAAATSVNKLTITTPATAATLTIANNKTLTANDTTTIGTNSITLGGGEVITFTASNALTLTTTGSTNVTLPTSGTLAAVTVAPVSYTPTWTNSGTANSLGNGTLTGYYTQIGKVVTFAINMTVGTTTTFGNGRFIWSLPTAGDASVVTNGYTFMANRFKSVGSVYSQGLATAESTTTFSIQTVASWNSTTPTVWATSDTVTITGTYIAS